MLKMKMEKKKTPNVTIRSFLFSLVKIWRVIDF